MRWKSELSKELSLFLIGGAVYYLIEVAVRGYSHWSMFILGGICFVLIGLLNETYHWDTPLQYQCLIGAAIITILEFVTGVLINIGLGWNVWDYSNEPYNFMGQICLSHSIYWVFLSGVAIIVDDWIRYKVFNEERPHYVI